MGTADKKLADLLTTYSAEVGPSVLALAELCEWAEVVYAFTGWAAVTAYGGTSHRPDETLILLDWDGWNQLTLLPSKVARSNGLEHSRGWLRPLSPEMPHEGFSVWVGIQFRVLQRRERVLGLWVESLPALIERLLGPRLHALWAEVVTLIRARKLDESFVSHLPGPTHARFLNCLEEVRRDEEYKAREGIG